MEQHGNDGSALRERSFGMVCEGFDDERKIGRLLGSGIGVLGKGDICIRGGLGLRGRRRGGARRVFRGCWGGSGGFRRVGGG